jgi:hypothetical protein
LNGKVVPYFDNVKMYTLENGEVNLHLIEVMLSSSCIMLIRKSYSNGYPKLSDAKPYFELMICFNPCLD